MLKEISLPKKKIGETTECSLCGMFEVSKSHSAKTWQDRKLRKSNELYKLLLTQTRLFAMLGVKLSKAIFTTFLKRDVLNVDLSF
jgi:hypothetical protein